MVREYSIKKQCDREWLYYNYVVLNRSRADIAKECGVSEATIKTHLLQKRIVKNKKYEKYDKEELYQLYIIDGKTVPEIAELYKCSDDTIYRALDKFEIRKITQFQPKFNDKEIQEIINLYVNENWSAEQLAKKYNTQHNIIIKYLRNNGIQTRGLSESQWNYNKKVFPDILLDKLTVEELYINQRMSKKDIGIMFNCEPTVIDRILKLHQIPIRNNSEAKQGLMIGEKHPNWQGGITPLMARCREFFQVNLAPKVRERDWYSCKICGSKKQLHVHHIKSFSSIVKQIIDEHPNLDVQKDINELYDIITHDERFLDLENLITYCKECHYYKIHCYERSISSQALDTREGSTTIEST